MIQRKQSVWLLLAALLSAGVFYFDLYQWHMILINGKDGIVPMRVNDNFPSFLLALVMCVLPLIAIFMFNKRKMQVNMALLSILTTIAFIALQVWRVSLAVFKQPVTSSSYWIGSVLPVMAIVFLIMAIVGIRKDEKLVKSVDRLR